MFAGTNEGIFRFREDIQQWEKVDTPPDLKKVQALTFDPNNGFIFVGTQEKGIFYLNEEEEWTSPQTPQDQKTLQDQNIRSLTVNPANSQVFAGTASGDVWRSLDNGNTWQPIANTQPGTGTIKSKGNIITGIRTTFRQESKEGESLIAIVQNRTETRQIARITSETELWVDRAFSVDLETETPFEISSFALSQDNSINALAVYTKPEKGTISSQDRTVKGIGTNFTAALQSGATIIALGQVKSVTQVKSDTKLTIDELFNPPLPDTGTLFWIPRSGTGTISSSGTMVTGQGTAFDQELEVGDNLIVEKDIRTVISVSLTIDSQFEPDLAGKHFWIARPGRGTLASQETTVTGTGTHFKQELQNGDRLIVNEHIRIVREVKADDKLILNQAFDSSLTGADFLIARPGIGTISSQGTTVTAFATDIKTGDKLVIDDQQIRTVNGFTLTLDRSFSNNLSNKPFFILSNTSLFAGTASGGVFRFLNNGDRWEPINVNLKDREIRSLVVNGNNGYLFAGGANGGVFRSTNQGEFWDALNVGLTNLSVQVLALNPSNQDIWAGATTGIFHATDNGNNWTDIQWQRLNQGLSYRSVQTIAMSRYQGALSLWVGTKEGAFRSTDKGQNWQPMDTVLKNSNVQTLLAIDTNQLLAGTQTGLFSSSDGGENWQTMNLGLVRPQVQTLATLDRHSIFAGALIAGTLKGSVFRSSDGGKSWIPTSLSNQDIRVLITNPDTHEIWAGTAGSGIFRSDNQGSTWHPLTDTRSASGTIESNDITVRGTHTKFASELKVGDQIMANGQTRSVVTLDAQNSDVFTIDVPFRPDLPPKTTFIVNTGLKNLYVTALALYVQSGTGTIASTDTTVNGTNTKFTQELEVGDVIRVGKQARIVTRIISDTELKIDTAFSALAGGTSFTVDILWAGTAGSGVFRSRNGGRRWQELNNGLTNLEIRCLAADADTGRIFAGTALGGVFCIKPKGDRWESFSTGLTNTDVRAIAIDEGNIFIGGIGILLSADGFNAAEVKPDDLLYVTAPPNNPDGLQTWQLRDRNQFNGELKATTPQDIRLYPATKDDPIVSEIGTALIPPDDERRPVIVLEQPLQHSYDPETVIIYVNIVKATHGETVSQEILGSGNSAIPNQRFTLQKLPLTYVPALTPSGGKSELKVYVNNVEWTEVADLYPLDAQSQSYIIRLEDDGTTSIIFGDGQRGARLPSGRENIMATYRSGIGLAGEVAAGSLALRKTGPPNILEVTNPLPATGAAPRESLIEARTNAPATVRTLDRIVSLRDFEDFAHTFAGIGKAQSVTLRNGETHLVHVTVAGVEGRTVDPSTELYQSLVKAIDAARDLSQRVQIDSYQPLYFKLEARILLNPRYQADKAILAIRQQLLQHFAFKRREFGQSATNAEAIAAIQAVEGVTAVDLDAFSRRDRSKTLESSIPALTASWERTQRQIQPAQLLLLRAEDILLTPVATL